MCLLLYFPPLPPLSGCRVCSVDHHGSRSRCAGPRPGPGVGTGCPRGLSPLRALPAPHGSAFQLPERHGAGFVCQVLRRCLTTWPFSARAEGEPQKDLGRVRPRQVAHEQLISRARPVRKASFVLLWLGHNSARSEASESLLFLKKKNKKGFTVNPGTDQCMSSRSLVLGTKYLTGGI